MPVVLLKNLEKKIFLELNSPSARFDLTFPVTPFKERKELELFRKKKTSNFLNKNFFFFSEIKSHLEYYLDNFNFVVVLLFVVI